MIPNHSREIRNLGTLLLDIGNALNSEREKLKNGALALAGSLWQRRIAWRALVLAAGLGLAAAAFDRRILTWRLDQLLRDIPGEVYQPLQRYLQGDNVPLKRFQLAHHLADALDQYQVLRGEMLDAWQSGKSVTSHGAEAWQMALWQRLLARALRYAIERDRAERHHPWGGLRRHARAARSAGCGGSPWHGRHASRASAPAAPRAARRSGPARP